MGAKGGSTPTSSTVTQTNLPGYAEPYYTDLMAKGQALTNSPYKPYTGPRLAGFSSDTLNSYQGIRDIAGSGMPGFGQAQGMVNNSLQSYDPTQYNANSVSPYDMVGSPTYDNLVQRYMNPYLSTVLEAQKSSAVRDYDRQKADRNASYVKAGAFGGSRQAVSDYLGEEGLLNRLSGIDATGYNQAWNQAHGAALDSQRYNIDSRLRSDLANQDASLRANQLSETSRQFGSDLGIRGAGLYGDLESTKWNALTEAQKNLAAIGSDYQNQAQTALDLKYEDFLNARDYPRQNLQFMAGLLHGVPTSVNQSASNAVYQSPVSSLLGSGITGYALSQLMGGK